MSRSVKKNPVIKDNGQSKKEHKKIANRKMRRKLNNVDFELADGKDYRKLTDSWDIADVVQRWSKEDAIAYYNSVVTDRRAIHQAFKEDFLKDYPTLQDFLDKSWKKEFIRK